ncbi:outer membrane protein assembly factor BamA [Hippea maritima]|uniref:Outer membrane protein assembly factor BamA n=1 Tax=Hippea maritima (strain ATCC 700847 / DSM 10411 / MH2) TaxID=760142 RepID=F2LXD5_HIPMA|nr:outer membrane protein assembly factor BamA [Hippea maritima]AEA34249.1 outer membrane protein assembly complex, YaeT protein [Hippea maritima DSM 10411]
MKKIKALFILFFVVLSLEVYAKPVVSIRIKGNLRTDKETIKNVIKTKVGSKASIKQIDKDILNIYSLGFYKTVSATEDITQNGVIITFKVKEKPSVRYIMFKGNDEISDKKLQKALKIKPYNILNKKLIESTIDNIMGMYASKGMYLTRINYTLKKVSGNRVDIIFHIKESKETVIRDINIIGNKHLDVDELKDGLKNHVKKGPYILTFLPWFYTGKLRIDSLESDRQKIIDKYLSKGYLDVDVSEPMVNIEPDTGIVHIDISIHEGQPYKLSSIGFKDIDPLKPQKLLEVLNLEKGKPLNVVKLRKAIEKITDMYGDLGYAFADVYPDIRKNKKTHEVELTIIVNKGQKVYISRIEITGNIRTHDNVIRRELLLKEGSLYSTTKIKKSKRNITNLDYFENVKIKTKRIAPNKVKMIVDVKEKRTGMLSLGVGYGSYTKFGAMGSISETNLFGTGIHGKLSANISSKSSLFDLNLTNPWWHNKPISIGVDIFHQEFDNYDYKRKSTGIVPAISKRFWDQTLTVGVKYSITRDKITLDTDNPGYYLKEQEGTHTDSSIIPFISYNTLDNYILPTKGINSNLTLRFAGLGGDRRYYKAVLFSEYFHPLFWDFIGHIKGEGGIIKAYGGKKTPVDKRFFIGGIDSLRGFEEGKVSPEDSDGNYIGGEKEFYGSAEVIFPIIEALHFYGVVFGDVGNCWTNSFGSIKKDAGVEIRWISPLGPIRISIGKNLSPKDGEKSTVFLFSAGALF